MVYHDEPLRCRLCQEIVVGVGYVKALEHAREKHADAMKDIPPATEGELVFCDNTFEEVVV